MAKAGRPPILDDDKKGRICGLLRAGLGLMEAAEYVGCCPKTIRNAADDDEKFGDEMRQAKIHCQYEALQNLSKAAPNSWRASAWLLSRCNRPRFGPIRQDMIPRREYARAIISFIEAVGEEIKDEELIRRICERVKEMNDMVDAVVNFDDGNWQ